jgi:hypothetical protein
MPDPAAAAPLLEEATRLLAKAVRDAERATAMVEREIGA